MYSFFSKNEILVMKYISKHNYVTNAQVSKYLGKTTNYTSHLMQGYIESDYLGKKNITNKLVVYWAKQKLIDILGFSYKSIKKLNLVTINHSLILNDLELYLVNKDKEDKWFTERDIFYDNIIGLRLNRIFESPDGILERNGKKFAIELELSKKNINNWRTKLSFYNKLIENNDISGVLYYTFNLYVKNKLDELKIDYVYTNRIEINNLSVNEYFKSYSLV